MSSCGEKLGVAQGWEGEDLGASNMNWTLFPFPGSDVPPETPQTYASKSAVIGLMSDPLMARQPTEK